MGRRGRPQRIEKYRHNIIRVSALEDTLLRILETIPPRSVKARAIVKEELRQLQLREISKTIKSDSK
ncbi:hypothetical protein P4679_33235 [Priestia megaterium]|uniref:hypothetical protein n=1 Tax=Priestia megaterium TaxID=1404 RepID=UPI002E1B69C1|nr:hypothetical protein [Priestia megaterium]